MSPMSGSLTQAAFDASFQQNLSVMKLFPGHPATAGSSAPRKTRFVTLKTLEGKTFQATHLPPPPQPRPLAAY